MSESKAGSEDATRAALLALIDGRPIVLVGMMGAGKTTVGRRLAQRLGWKFVDSDKEIETASRTSVEEFFALHGEAEFRAGETRVISRILKTPNIVLATGGGAFINADSRALIKENALSVWIKAEFDLLFARVSRRSNRPLLKTPDPKQTLRDLIEARYPVYAEADVTVQSSDVPHDSVADAVILAVTGHLKNQQTGSQVKNAT